MCTQMEKRGTLSRVNDETTRDPFNTAVASILSEIFQRKDFGEARLVRATGIPRATVRRYLSGERDIRIAELRKIADAFEVSIADIITQAEGRIE